MSVRRRCDRCGRFACATMCAVLGAVATPTAGVAQSNARLITATARPIESTASVVIGAVFRLEPDVPVLTASGAPTDECAPLRCYRGSLTVRSNQRWQLQVRTVSAIGADSAISWRPTEGAPLPVSAAWQTIREGSAPTAGTVVPLRFGVGAAITPRPDPLSLSAMLEFRVLPLP